MSTKAPLSQRLRKRWDKLSLTVRQLSLFTAAEAVVVLVLLLQGLLFAPILDDILLEYSEAELSLLGKTYDEKVHFMSVYAEVETDNEGFVELLTTRHPSHEQHDHVQEELQSAIDSMHIEFASLLDLGTGRIRVSGNGNRTGGYTEMGDLMATDECTQAWPVSASTGLLTVEEFEAEGATLWRERLSELNPVAADHIADTGEEGLIRWVLAPILVDEHETVYDVNGDALPSDCEALNGTRVGGMLLLGDLVNGKVPIVEETLARFGSGFAAVWYRNEEEQRFVQATSYMAFQQKGHSATLAGIELEHSSVVRDAYDDHGSHHPLHDEVDIIGNMYTLAGKSTTEDVVLIRGTDHELRDEKVGMMVTDLIILGAVLLVTDCLVQFHTIRAFVGPLEKLGRKMASGRNGKGANLTPKDIDSIPRKSTFIWRTAVSQVGLIVGLIVMLVISNDAVHSMQASVVSSELSTMEHFYMSKTNDMQIIAHRLSSELLVTEAVEQWNEGITNSGECVDMNGTSLVALKHDLKHRALGSKVELALLVDKHQRVIVAGNGADPDDEFFMRCDHFDPDGIVSAVLDSPKEVHHTGSMSTDDYHHIFTDLDSYSYFEPYTDPDTGEEFDSELHPEVTIDQVMIRWVAAPVYTSATVEAADLACEPEATTDAVLVLGEVVNGKLGIPAAVTEVFNQGYSAVYLWDEAIEEFVLVTSLLKDPESRVYSDVELASTALLQSAMASASGTASNEAMDIAGHLYTAKVMGIPHDVWIDEFGERDVDTNAPAFFVRAHTVELTGDVKADQVTLILVTIAGLVVALFMRITLAWQSYLPAQALMRAMKRAGVRSSTAKASSYTTGTSKTSYSDMELATASTIAGSAYRHFHHFKRMGWQNWLVAALVLSCVGALASVLPAVTTGGELEGFEEAADLAALMGHAEHYITEVQLERELTGQLVDGGWDVTDDDEAEQFYVDTVIAAELVEQRHHVDERNVEFLHALTEYRDDTAKAVRRSVYAHRSWRSKVDLFQFDTSAEADALVEAQISFILDMLAAVVQVPTDHDTAQVAFAALTAMQAQEHLAVETEHLRAALHYGEFHTVAEAASFFKFYAAEHSWTVNLDGTTRDNEYHEIVARALQASHDLTYEYSELASHYPASLAEPEFPSETVWVHNLTMPAVHAYAEMVEELVNAVPEVAHRELAEVESYRDAIFVETIIAMALQLLLLPICFYKSPRDIRRQLKRVEKALQTDRKVKRRRILQLFTGFLFALLALPSLLGVSVAAWGAAVGHYTEAQTAVDDLEVAVKCGIAFVEFVGAAQHERRGYHYASDSDELLALRADSDAKLAKVDTAFQEDWIAYWHDFRDQVDLGVEHWPGSVAAEDFHHVEEELHYLMLQMAERAIDATQLRLFNAYANSVFARDSLSDEDVLMDDEIARGGTFNSSGEFAEFAEFVAGRDEYARIFTVLAPALVDHLPAGPEVEQLLEWEAMALEYPDDLSPPLTLDTWAGNVTVVLELWTALEEELAAELTADVQRARDAATDDFVATAIPHLWCTAVTIATLVVFLAVLYPTMTMLKVLGQLICGPGVLARRASSAAVVAIAAMDDDDDDDDDDDEPRPKKQLRAPDTHTPAMSASNDAE